MIPTVSPASTFVGIAPETISRRIFFIRGHKVMLDANLAELYDVETRALNQAVKRNVERFPSDFMFQLSKAEKLEVITNCDHLAKLKFSPTLPYAFTEHGAMMLGNILKSDRAVEVSIIRPSHRLYRKGGNMTTTRNKHDPPVRVTASASNPTPCITLTPITTFTRNNPQEHTLC